MAQVIPVVLDARLVGRKPASEFKRDGQTIAIPEKLQLLVDRFDGSVSMLEVSGGQLDQASPPYDHRQLALGERVRLHGEAVIQDRGADRDSYLRIAGAEALAADAAPLRAAKSA